MKLSQAYIFLVVRNVVLVMIATEYQHLASKEEREMEEQKEISFLKPVPLIVMPDDMWIRGSQLIQLCM